MLHKLKPQVFSTPQPVCLLQKRIVAFRCQPCVLECWCLSLLESVCAYAHVWQSKRPKKRRWRSHVKTLLKVLVYFGQNCLISHSLYIRWGRCFNYTLHPPPPAALCWTNKKGHLSAASACVAAVRVDGALAGFHWHNEEFNIPPSCVTNNL